MAEGRKEGKGKKEGRAKRGKSDKGVNKNKEERKNNFSFILFLCSLTLIFSSIWPESITRKK